MSRIEMMDNIIRLYGFEADETIGFCLMCENHPHDPINDKRIEISYEILLTMQSRGGIINIEIKNNPCKFHGRTNTLQMVKWWVRLPHKGLKKIKKVLTNTK